MMPADNYPAGVVSRMVDIELECRECEEIIEKRVLDELGSLHFDSPECDCGSDEWETR